MLWPNVAFNFGTESGSTNANTLSLLQFLKNLGFKYIRCDFPSYFSTNDSSSPSISQIKYNITTAKSLGFTVVAGVGSINKSTGGPTLTQQTYPTYQVYQQSFAAFCQSAGVDIFEVGNETERDVLYSKTGNVTQSGNVVTVTMTAHPFFTGDLIYATGMSPDNYNTPAYVSPGSPGGATITVTDANHFTYPISGNPASPATGGFIRFANIGTLELENNLLADAATCRALYPNMKYSYSFNDTYLPNWLAIGLAGISNLDLLGFHEYASLTTFQTNVTSFFQTFGPSGKGYMTEWGSNNGRSDFKTTGAFNTNWETNWELDTFARLNMLKTITAQYAPNAICYLYSMQEGQQLWSIHNVDSSFNYPLFILSGTRRLFV